MDTWKDRCIRKQWEKNLKARVDREDLQRWSKGFDSEVGYQEDFVAEEREHMRWQEAQDMRDEMGFFDGRLQSMSVEVAGR
jgi:hypothetical protein